MHDRLLLPLEERDVQLEDVPQRLHGGRYGRAAIRLRMLVWAGLTLLLALGSPAGAL